MRHLKPAEYHIYLDEQQYFIEVVLDISRIPKRGDHARNGAHVGCPANGNVEPMCAVVGVQGATLRRAKIDRKLH